MSAFANLQSFLSCYLFQLKPSAAFDKLSFDGCDLFYEARQIAKVSVLKRSAVLSSSKEIPDEINDELLKNILKIDYSFTRIDSFSKALNLNQINDDLNLGDTKSLLQAAIVYDVSLDLSLVDDLTAVSDLEKKYQEKLEKAKDKALESKSKLLEPLVAIAKELLEKQKQAEKAAQEEAAREANEKWDAGESFESYDPIRKKIRGAGGKGQRLRIIKRGGVQERLDVQGSSDMYRTSLNSFKSVFNKIAPYAWGGKLKELSFSTWNGRADVGNTRSHNIEINQNGKVAWLGCQELQISELERFATMQGWPLDGSPIPA